MTLRAEERQEAHDELLAEFDYYNDQRDGLGLRFLAAVDSAIKDITEWPDSWPPIPDWEGEPTLRARRVNGFPFRVLYLIDAHTVVIFAYAHDRREPGYWQDRING